MENKINKLDFWGKDENGRYYHICEGTGDNLLQEDIDLGYVDYIYYEIYADLNGVHENEECDGGMVLLKEYYQDLTLRQIVNKVKDMEDIETLHLLN